jgi:nucleotide-binding universal stress UspA family protein
MRRIRRILHPTDFSPASRPAFNEALEMAKATDAQLLVVHVLPPVPVVPEAYMNPDVWDQLHRGQRAVGERQLNRLLARAKAAGVRASSLLVDVGVTHEQIVRAAKRQRADLIVMGTHGRTGLTRALLGSVAARVIATAKCPVLTVHAK